MSDNKNTNIVRLEYVDWAKAVMIILVIIGHICQNFFSKSKDENLFAFIYSFHMPLFFLLSGFVMGITQKRLQSQSFITWIWKKIYTLLIPFFIWGLFVYRFIDPVSFNPLSIDAFLQLLERPDCNAPWFLISLFCIQVVCYPIFRYDKIYTWLIPISFLVLGGVGGGVISFIATLTTMLVFLLDTLFINKVFAFYVPTLPQ